MRALTSWTAGLVGDRDPAQPLLTLLDGPARVELSGATTANWVAKTANLLVDGLGAPQRMGVALPLHWQTLVVVLAGVATGATVAVVDDAAALVDCDVVFTTAGQAAAALDAGAAEVLAVSLHPLGAPLPDVPAGALDHARELPAYADNWSGAVPPAARIEVDGHPLGALPELGLGVGDRVLTDARPADAGGLAVLLAVLHEGAALVLLPDAATVDVGQAAAAERVTASAGLQVPGVRLLAAGGIS